MNRRSFLSFLSAAPLAVPVAIVSARVEISPESEGIAIWNEVKKWPHGRAARLIAHHQPDKYLTRIIGEAQQVGEFLFGPSDMVMPAQVREILQRRHGWDGK